MGMKRVFEKRFTFSLQDCRTRIDYVDVTDFRNIQFPYAITYKKPPSILLTKIRNNSLYLLIP